jgi:BirA family transcriptional regulator, biotin operon repressor / biotin---[acetyl-CoA-carboxylase] ligase
MKLKVFSYKRVTSTNDIAINLIKNNKKEEGCVHAIKQTKGRGTHGKRWISTKGNFFGSIFFPLKKNYPPFSEFTTINAVIIAKVIENFCEKKHISFKWPNDVFVKKKKICGILQEHITLNNKPFLIIGIGLNILSNPKNTKKYQATNIFEETKKKPPMKKILKNIINSYENFFINLSSYKFGYYKKKVKLMALS